MWDEILNLAIKNGLWAVLFMGLFIFVIKDSASREKKYQDTIKDLTTHLGVVNSIKEEVQDIKNIVYKQKRRTKKTENSAEIKENDKTENL